MKQLRVGSRNGVEHIGEPVSDRCTNIAQAKPRQRRG